jgi:hypothetical protein
MMVWIASYPRAGHTLLLMMFHRVFVLPSRSQYVDKIVQTPDVAAFASAGHQPTDESWEDLYRHKRQQPRRDLTNTRHVRLDDNPPSHVGRKGFTSVNSDRHFFRV